MTLFEEVLNHLGNRADQHAKFMNTLSLLEYIGARKIVKSQMENSLDLELLSHIAEEIRHAQILKTLALRLSDGALDTYSDTHLLAGTEGRSYIQTVDRSVEALMVNVATENRNLAYYWLTTLLIEERAAVIYPLYDRYLERFGLTGKLSSIVRDEDKHLEAVTLQIRKSLPQADCRLRELRAIEDQSFQNFMTAVLRS